MSAATPPAFEFFDAPRPAAGSRELILALGDLRIAIEGLDDHLAGRLAGRFGPFVVEGPEREAAVRATLGLEAVDYFIEPPPRRETNRVLLACDGSRVRYLGYRLAGWFDTASGAGGILLARGEYEPAERAIENWIRAAVAWSARERGGALVHAASAVLEGRAYLFYGASGAGKSTLSASSRRGHVVSDDLSLVLPGEGSALEVVGSPFRGTYEGGATLPGRWPLAAGFRLIKAETAAVREVARVRALAELVGNLPFVAEAFGTRPDLFAGVERAFRAVPLAHLHFRKGDDGFWDAIRAAGL